MAILVINTCRKVDDTHADDSHEDSKLVKTYNTVEPQLSEPCGPHISLDKQGIWMNGGAFAMNFYCFPRLEISSDYPES